MKGYGSGEYTPLKVEHFRSLLSMHLAVVAAVLQRHANSWFDPCYKLIDITAGPGLHPVDGSPQAPLVFAEAAARMAIRHAALFFEQEAEAFQSLRAAMSATSCNARVVHRPHAEAKRCGVRVYEKANLLDRIRQYPTLEIPESIQAPESLRYLPTDNNGD